jgi:hypothetical protein
LNGRTVAPTNGPAERPWLMATGAAFVIAGEGSGAFCLATTGSGVSGLASTVSGLADAGFCDSSLVWKPEGQAFCGVGADRRLGPEGQDFCGVGTRGANGKWRGWWQGKVARRGEFHGDELGGAAEGGDKPRNVQIEWVSVRVGCGRCKTGSAG